MRPVLARTTEVVVPTETGGAAATEGAVMVVAGSVDTNQTVVYAINDLPETNRGNIPGLSKGDSVNICAENPAHDVTEN